MIAFGVLLLMRRLKSHPTPACADCVIPKVAATIIITLIAFFVVLIAYVTWSTCEVGERSLTCTYGFVRRNGSRMTVGLSGCRSAFRKSRVLIYHESMTLLYLAACLVVLL